jgi:hypothetical protein
MEYIREHWRELFYDVGMLCEVLFQNNLSLTVKARQQAELKVGFFPIAKFRISSIWICKWEKLKVLNQQLQI